MKTSLLKSVIIVVVMSLFVAPVVANKIGSSCDNPIQLTKGLQMTISEPGSYWFSSWTYDLPLKVRFTPDVATQEKPMVYVDFTCTPGVYDDPNLYELTDLATGWGIDVPMLFKPTSSVVDGKVLYELSVEESHRDLMREFGISYDVEAKVEVIVPVPGKVELVPDTVFRNCVEASQWVSLPDTIGVTPVDFDKTYVLPISDWKEDSVRFTWMGKKQALTLWIGKDCSFNLDENDKLFACKYVLNPVEGQNTLDFTPADLKGLYQYGSLLYAKFVSTETADVVFDYKPMSPEMARAIPMPLDQPVAVKKNNIDQYYYFKAEYAKKALEFTAAKKDTIVAYFGTTPTFELQTAEHVATYTLYPDAQGSLLSLSTKQISAFTKNVTSEHLFVRFDAPNNTEITLSLWDASTCANNSIEVLPNAVTAIASNSSSTIYRIDYNKWRKGDVELHWSGSQNVVVYLADTCLFALKADDPHVLDYKSVAKNGTHTITKDLMDSVVDRVDGDGYLYFRFNSRRAGNITTTQTLDSAFLEPGLPTSPCVVNSIELKAGDQLTLNLDSAFTIYRIKYAEFAAQDRTLTWTGATDLHTFVAETCTFAVAPYNKYVHVYVPVPAQGETLWTMAQLADLAAFVDEDGYLYIRFLTEKEGVLTVK